jgi:hypothetical protein
MAGNSRSRPRPSGPVTIYRAKAIETEVSSLLLELPMHLDEAWLLPQSGTLCLIRYADDHHGEARKNCKVHEEKQGEEEARGPRSKTGKASLDTPRPRLLGETLWIPRVHSLQTPGPRPLPTSFVDTRSPGSITPVSPCPQPTLWPWSCKRANDGKCPLYPSLLSSLVPIYFVPPPFSRVSKAYID